jgi:3-hydroxybutyryl-CoA dehydratase
MPKVTEFSVGQKASMTKVMSKQDVEGFAKASGDTNPIHLNEEFAKSTQFGRCVVHGILQAGLISAVLGTKLPGPGGIYREQTCTFKRPAFVGDEITAEVEITEINEKIGLLVLKTVVRNSKGELLVVGNAKGLVDKA